MPNPYPPDWPAPLINLADYEAQARQGLAPDVWAYLDGDAADSHTRRDNQAAWQALKLRPRVLRPLGAGHSQCELFGHRWPSPLLLAPTAYHRLAHADGEVGSALAAAVVGAGMVLSTLSSMPVEAVAAAMQREPLRGPLWFQLYLQHDRGFNAHLVQRVESAGVQALVLTVDAPCQGVRDAERRHRFALPPDLRAVHLDGLAPRRTRAVAPQGSALFDDLLHTAPTWDDVAWLRSQTRLPLLLKGVLHADDARQAQALGVDGLIVSNHGGRTLDTALSTAQALAELAQAVPGLPLLVDGGIRRGTDVLKALALGARAVLIGRPVLHGLAVGGAQGVAHVLRLLRDELDAAMALTGCRTLADVGPPLLFQPPRA